MKITYLAEWSPYKTSGVLQKIESQTNQWIKRGHQVQLIFVYSDNPSERLISIPFEYFKSSIAFLKLPVGAKKFLNRMLVSKKVKKSIINFKPDAIYYRQSIYYPGLKDILSVAPTIAEINSNDIEEIKLFSKTKQLVYNWGRNKTIDVVKGFVCVTNEIENIYKNYNKRTITIANGIETTLYKEINRVKNSDKINLIFVGSPNQQWHGVDKVLEMAELFPQYNFHIVGPKAQNKSLENIKFHGYLSKKKLFELYSSMDFGIGTLALHRNRMHEACPLKTREYLLMGLPVILAYKDIDVFNEDFILELPNTENNIIPNKKTIETFIQSWKEKSIDKEKINTILSYEHKELKRLEFILSFCDK